MALIDSRRPHSLSPPDSSSLQDTRTRPLIVLIPVPIFVGDRKRERIKQDEKAIKKRLAGRVRKETQQQRAKPRKKDGTEEFYETGVLGDLNGMSTPIRGEPPLVARARGKSHRARGFKLAHGLRKGTVIARSFLHKQIHTPQCERVSTTYPRAQGLSDRLTDGRSKHEAIVRFTIEALLSRER